VSTKKGGHAAFGSWDQGERKTVRPKKKERREGEVTGPVFWDKTKNCCWGRGAVRANIARGVGVCGMEKKKEEFHKKNREDVKPYRFG